MQKLKRLQIGIKSLRYQCLDYQEIGRWINWQMNYPKPVILTWWQKLISWIKEKFKFTDKKTVWI